MASPEEMAASMEANLAEKTGKSLPEWVKIVKASDASKHGEIVKMLKTGHGMTHGYANLVAHRALASAADMAEPDDLVAAQYSGKKAHLKPVYDRLVGEIATFGPEAELAPKKTYVSLRRKKQFALIQPSTATRVDVGINLGDAPATGRLEASGSFNAMVSHRVRLEDESDVDDELMGWLKAAYDRAG